MTPEDFTDDWRQVNALIESVLADPSKQLDDAAITDCREFLKNDEPVVAFDIIAEELPERDARLVEAARLLDIEY